LRGLTDITFVKCLMQFLVDSRQTCPQVDLMSRSVRGTDDWKKTKFLRDYRKFLLVIVRMLCPMALVKDSRRDNQKAKIANHFS
jgi:hypothetical protein